ncbi:PTS N-acetylgalactosamine transporter subunit IID, partial [Vibrio anguillarum]|nr:PTS N-acetylgalactosamine transporter subunit IID [Vibrio anguillarum]
MESNVSNELDLRSQNADVQPAPGVAQDEYENKEIGAELTKADINRMA